MIFSDRFGFWKEALALRGSVTPRIMPSVLIFGFISAAICAMSYLAEVLIGHPIELEEAPYEIAGAVLGLLLVLRTNAGYERWWEARKFWGGIVNQTRNLVIAALSYGPSDARWREDIVRWTIVFAHASRCRLRGQTTSAEISRLLTEKDYQDWIACDHGPGFVAMKIGGLLNDACQRFAMDRFAFLQADKERATLIDHIGGCERILNTPLALAYSIKIRSFIALFLVVLPLVLLHRVGTNWLIPVITMLVAYPLLSVDEIGVELQNPFNRKNLSHLPLDTITDVIEGNLKGLLLQAPPELIRVNGQATFETAPPLKAPVG